MEKEKNKTSRLSSGNVTDIEAAKVVLYKKGLEVQLSEETVWLTQAQMSTLFAKNKRTVSEHIRNIFKEKELIEHSVVRKFRTTARDSKTYFVSYYNLDVIISVGYRVKSKRGTQFRIWATKIIVEGYTINERIEYAA
jgi:hypothetical protein